MKKLREVLRMKFEKELTHRQIARALSISPGTVGAYVSAWNKSTLSWQSASQWSEPQLLEVLLPLCQQRKNAKETRFLLPDFIKIHQAMKQKGVNRQLLYQEYQQTPTTLKHFSYNEFCRRYRAFCKTLKPSMRQTHVAGEKCFIDYCGPKLALYDKDNQTIIDEVYVFVATLGASQYTFAMATKTRSLPDWIDANVRAVHFFGGVPALMIPDNEKAGVKDACYYDPDVNPTYADFAKHYGTEILPTRPRHPQDKSLVEKSVQVVETWIMGKLRNERFHSLGALNERIAVLLEELNNKPFQKLPGSRRSQFESIDKPALKTLPATRYELAYYRKATVGLDYHVMFENHAYSVPSKFVKESVELRVTKNTLEVIHDNVCIASHLRSSEKGKSTTLDTHMPKAHLAHKQWTPKSFLLFGLDVGEAMYQLSKHYLSEQKHPECLYRIHNGFRNLLRQYGKVSLELACQYALEHNARRFKNIREILRKNLYRLSDDAQTKLSLPQAHKHVRGSKSYIH